MKRASEGEKEGTRDETFSKIFLNRWTIDLKAFEK